jgi:hypothetical protein
MQPARVCAIWPKRTRCQTTRCAGQCITTSGKGKGTVISHVVASGIIVTDLECLRGAVKKIKGLAWRENKKTYEWYGTWVGDYDQADAAFKLGIKPEDYGKCEHAIAVDGSEYEIGVIKRSDGTGYSLVWDFYGTGRYIVEAIGDGGERLLVEYQRAFLQKFAHTEGMNLTMEENGNEITIELEVGV